MEQRDEKGEGKGIQIREGNKMVRVKGKEVAEEGKGGEGKVILIV